MVLSVTVTETSAQEVRSVTHTLVVRAEGELGVAKRRPDASGAGRCGEISNPIFRHPIAIR
jgi:hypothetical protein